MLSQRALPERKLSTAVDFLYEDYFILYWQPGHRSLDTGVKSESGMSSSFEFCPLPAQAPPPPSRQMFIFCFMLRFSTQVKITGNHRALTRVKVHLCLLLPISLFIYVALSVCLSVHSSLPLPLINHGFSLLWFLHEFYFTPYYFKFQPGAERASRPFESQSRQLSLQQHSELNALLLTLPLLMMLILHTF